MSLTFGRPVVPLEKLKKASLVLPSPFLSFGSVYVFLAFSPASMSCGTVANFALSFPGAGSRRTIRSEGSFAIFAASSATPRFHGWTTSSLAFVVFRTWTSSSAV